MIHQFLHDTTTKPFALGAWVNSNVAYLHKEPGVNAHLPILSQGGDVVRDSEFLVAHKF